MYESPRNPLPFSSSELKPIESLARCEVIEAILAINPTASPEFLGRFTVEQLGTYLDHLSRTQMPRGGDHPWVRGKQPGVMVYKTTA